MSERPTVRLLRQIESEVRDLLDATAPPALRLVPPPADPRPLCAYSYLYRAEPCHAEITTIVCGDRFCAAHGARLLSLMPALKDWSA